MVLPGAIRIMRPMNSIVAGIAAVLAYFIATGTLIPAALVLVPIVFLITAGGNTINDYFDVSIDRINRPGRPIPSGELTPSGAKYLALALFSGGIILSGLTTLPCLLIAAFNSALLYLYASRLKGMLLIGNMTVAYLSASIFLFGGAFAGSSGIITISVIALMTFFAMLARELVKSSEDVAGDAAAGALTVPVEYGIRVAVLLSFIFALCGIMVSLFPVRWWGYPYLAGILAVDGVILAGTLKPARCRHPDCVRDSGASTLLKAGMFASLLVFTLSAALL